MTHIALDSQDEAVKRFFLSLPVDPQGPSSKSTGGHSACRRSPMATKKHLATGPRRRTIVAVCSSKRKWTASFPPRKRLNWRICTLNCAAIAAMWPRFPWPRRDGCLRNWNAKRRRRTHAALHLSRWLADSTARTGRRNKGVSHQKLLKGERGHEPARTSSAPPFQDCSYSSGKISPSTPMNSSS